MIKKLIKRYTDRMWNERLEELAKKEIEDLSALFVLRMSDYVGEEISRLEKGLKQEVERATSEFGTRRHIAEYVKNYIKTRTENRINQEERKLDKQKESIKDLQRSNMEKRIRHLELSLKQPQIEVGYYDGKK